MTAKRGIRNLLESLMAILLGMSGLESRCFRFCNVILGGAGAILCALSNINL
jgi:hypothetical protein